MSVSVEGCPEKQIGEKIQIKNWSSFWTVYYALSFNHFFSYHLGYDAVLLCHVLRYKLLKSHLSVERLSGSSKHHL